ncbi:dTDP-6-deoxy-L-talose 4-dehydrogenase (NAD+) [Cytobacillus eiseniae]|uniref:dTDP-6-deoxy-L-talose 4-dehydrogenase (NAD+) n=1 Tax=Cytobacillus eiseniae TaxID=762947 RepID=A0ABS4RHH7_9BACI|nr:NAD(P)-dependent oxidoreductase [Cytobacillus eiseniae]MBP2242349.1 dTDP-6-deoxy-L-talose 4-dehydrogenase (NAD+) [Cytobacillus eiseniae]
MKKRVAVTGAGGYIGRFVVNRLLDYGIDVTAVVNSNKQLNTRARIIEIDILSDYENIYERLGSPDVCLHLAWKDGFIHNSESHVENLYSHYRFIKNMVNGGLRHVAVMGTMHEVGYYEGEIDEFTPTNPYSLYGIAKNSLRQSLEVLLKDQNVVFQWLRAFYIVGDDLKNQSIFTKLIHAEHDGKELFPFTNGKNMYDFISVEELADQIALCVLQNKVQGVINCCTGKPISLREKVEEFLFKNNFKIKLDYGVFPNRPYDSPAIWGSNKKVKEVLAYSEKKSLQTITR